MTTHKDILRFFHRDLFIPELRASTRNGVLKEMAAWLESTKIVYRASYIYDLVKKREEVGSTGIGGSIAIPHCRSIAVEQLTVLLARKSKGVGFNSADKKSVKMFFMVVAPPHDVNYLVFLGKLVEILTDKKIKQALLKVSTFDEFANLISEGS